MTSRMIQDIPYKFQSQLISHYLISTDILSDIEARGKDAEQGRQAVADLFESRSNQMNVLSDIKDIGKEKEEGMKNVRIRILSRFILHRTRVYHSKRAFIHIHIT